MNATPASNDPVAADPIPAVWFDPQPEKAVEGRAFDDTEAFYHRLPARARQRVPERVWEESITPAGMVVRFETDSPELYARWRLESSPSGNTLACAAGEAGLDLYARDPSGQWRWVKTAEPWTLPEPDKQLVANAPPGLHEYLLYLPLRARLGSLKVGVAKGRTLRFLTPRPRPLLYYGTSIVHGLNASRPGMAHAHITARMLDRPLVNLGFAGCARMELPLASLLAEIDASIYVIDCLPNMSDQEVRDRAVPFVVELRRQRPLQPIVLVEDRIHTNAWFQPDMLEQHQRRTAALREAFARLQDQAVPGIHYVHDRSLLGDDDEATNDGSHPSDLGMMRQAQVMRRVLEPLLLACSTA